MEVETGCGTCSDRQPLSIFRLPVMDYRKLKEVVRRKLPV